MQSRFQRIPPLERQLFIVQLTLVSKLFDLIYRNGNGLDKVTSELSRHAAIFWEKTRCLHKGPFQVLKAFVKDTANFGL